MGNGSNATERPFKLLVIDDDRQILAMLCEFLSDLNYDVVSTSDSLEGLQLIEAETQRFDLVIMDLVMPKISGSYLVFKIKEKFPDMSVIGITGWGAYPDGFTEETQVDRILEKPFDLFELDRAIKELLFFQTPSR